MVEVFKTNLKKKQEAEKIIKTLQILLPLAKINFDLEDCDNILRIEDANIHTAVISEYLLDHKIIASTLE